jgi:endonuclease/exonuclease/phosphatase family metal-dependent hydrolase
MIDSFSLLTLNCFGALAPNTTRRLLALAQELENRSDHVVCLQEVQLHRHRALLSDTCTSFTGKVYEPHFYCPKGGLLTLSRIPVAGGSFESYVHQGLWFTPMIMDVLLRKGMLITRVEWAGRDVFVINTHLVANYIGDWEQNGMYARAEKKQLDQLAKTVHSLPEESVVIVVGDINIPRGCKLYRDFILDSGLMDPLAGDTRPTHRPPFGVPAQYSLPIDHILVRLPSSHSLKVECDLCFTDKYQIKGKHQGYLSDHRGIEIRISSAE